MSRRLARSGPIVPLLALFAMLAGCRDQPAGRAPETGPARLMVPSELSEAEKRYGRSAYADPKVTLQPDVVLLPAGAEAVRSAGDDGISWTIDAGARGADDIRPGRSCS